MVTARVARGSCINLGSGVKSSPVQMCERSLCPAPPHSGVMVSVLAAGCTTGFGRPMSTQEGPAKPSGGKTEHEAATLGHTSKGGMGTDARGRIHCHFQAGLQLQD